MLGKSPVKVAVAATAIALFAAGCSKATEDPGKPKSGGSIITSSGEPESLIPADTNESEGSAVVREVYAGLTGYDPKSGEAVNLVAESITSDDAKLWTVKLKKNFKFHNGEPVNADSFINAWNFAAYGPNGNGNSYFFDRIEGYDALQSKDPDGEDGPKTAPEPAAKTMTGLKKVDDYEFTIQLTVPFSSWPLVVGYNAFFPMAKACLDDVKACNEKPIGNGPFKMDGSWNHKVEIKLVRNDDYAGEKAKIDSVTFKIYADIKTAFQDFQAGTIDLIDSVHPSQYKQAKQNFPNNLNENPSSSFAYLGFPLYNDNFKDVRIRKAFSMAIDRQAMIDAAFDGRMQPADSLVSPVVGGYKAGACDYCKLDADKAKALLAEAGGWKGGKLKIWFNAGGGHEIWTKILGDQIKQNLGIDYELVGNLQFAEYLGVADAHNFDGLFRLGWIMDYPVMENYLKPLHGCQGSSNNTTVCIPEADALIAKGDAAKDPKEAAGFYQQAEALLLEQAPIIPVYFSKSAWLKADKIKSITYNRVTTLDFATAVVEE